MQELMVVPMFQFIGACLTQMECSSESLDEIGIVDDPTKQHL